MRELLSISLVMLLCFPNCATHLIQKKLPGDVSADDKKFVANHQFIEIKTESENAEENSSDSKFRQIIHLDPPNQSFSKSKPTRDAEAELKSPYIFNGLGGFGNSGFNTVVQGLESVAGFVGGKLGLILGGPVGVPLGALLGGLRGAYKGSEIGSQIAKSPFKLFKGSLGGQTFGSYTSYPGTDGVKYIIVHP